MATDIYGYEPFHLWAIAQAAYTGRVVTVDEAGLAQARQLVDDGLLESLGDAGSYALTERGRVVANWLLATLDATTWLLSRPAEPERREPSTLGYLVRLWWPFGAARA
ncbi:hypothetical protein [Rhodomicrobium lacus]|uniref:hypothetical protein n=1 Tax=Rhodomicrobium lacus TaxID=2498452 RepID=UPI000F8EC3FB|nr:hypothetical protein [Rhodomicrobium lacus]